MATIVRGQQEDKYVRAIKTALDEYEAAHPGASAELYRQNTASIRIRIVDHHFAEMSAGERHDSVWRFLAERLEDDTMQEISVLLPLSPRETKKSFMSSEFDDPIPSSF